MHARIDQLLSLRDGEPVDAGIAIHVRQCAECAAELQRVAVHRRAMQALPSLATPDVWPAVHSRLQSAQRLVARSRWAAGLAILVLGGVFLLSYQQRGEELSTPADLASQPLPIGQLTLWVDRSRALEHALSRMPQRPAVERAGTAATIDGLEERIQWVDHHLNQAADTGLNEHQSERLWQERVALLDTLVRVRYAESGSYVF